MWLTQALPSSRRKKRAFRARVIDSGRGRDEMAAPERTGPMATAEDSQSHARNPPTRRSQSSTTRCWPRFRQRRRRAQFKIAKPRSEVEHGQRSDRKRDEFAGRDPKTKNAAQSTAAAQGGARSGMKQDFKFFARNRSEEQSGQRYDVAKVFWYWQ